MHYYYAYLCQGGRCIGVCNILLLNICHITN